MDDLHLAPGFDFVLDPFGQQPSLNIYTQLTSCYNLPDTVSYPDLIDVLQDGLRRLSANFPWVAGQIVKTKSDEDDDSCTFRIRPSDVLPPLAVQDLREDESTPSMAQMKGARFPFSMLDETVIAPINTFPDPTLSPIPVLAMQATVVNGGFLLTFLAHHQVMDMTGLAQIMHLLSKACYGESYTEEEFLTGNLTRHSIIPLLDDDWKPMTVTQDKKETTPQIETSNNPDEARNPPSCSWVYLSFGADQLAALKSMASEAVKGSPAEFVSTDDSLSAFIWQTVARIRLARFEPAKKSTFARAVDPRRFLDIPVTYPGLVQNMTYHTRTLQELSDASLGEIASNLRAAVDPRTSTLGHDTRALATMLDRAKDKSKVSVTSALDLSSDIMLSSWANVKSYDLDFNFGLGKPEAVRRPQFTPVESLVYLMPKRSDGEIVVGLCLRDQDMDRLRADEELLKFASFIG